RAAEYRDDDTGEHTWRVAQVAGTIGRYLSLPESHVETLMRAARLHDVGKITVPDGILLKPNSLTPEEYSVVKGHTRAGAELLAGSRSPTIKLAETIALTHHERWDGLGYPQGLQGDKIPLESRIIAVSDTWDAITRDRSHKKALSFDEAVHEIAIHSGTQFDPRVVEAFMAAVADHEINLPENNPEPTNRRF
ncbi:MAG: HD domain-containing protein, partial [Trueperaceae bacterium]|nr:HD domain-containing protein [Trueperaceae bacterium]